MLLSVEIPLDWDNVAVVKSISSVHPTGNDQLTAYHSWVDHSKEVN